MDKLTMTRSALDALVKAVCPINLLRKLSPLVERFAKAD
jgi:hypothetical protein